MGNAGNHLIGGETGWQVGKLAKKASKLTSEQVGVLKKGQHVRQLVNLPT
jgi:hypothetical protein